MDFEAQISKNHEQNTSKNVVFFESVFLSILGGFGEGFGRVLGGAGAFLASPGPLLAVIF